jgi:heme exporter protein B
MSELPPPLWPAFSGLLRRDLTIAFRHRAELANPLLFFVIVVSLFPLGITPQADLLTAMAPGLIWVAALLSSMLSLDSIFRSDYEDGSLEQLLLSPQPLAVLVLAKIIAHWLVTGVPLLLLAPLLTPVLSLVGAIGVALTVGLRRGGVLLSLLVLPLYIPVLIFAANAVASAGAGLEVSGQLYFLAALLLLALSLAPLAAASALRISLG